MSALFPATCIQPTGWLNDALIGFASSVNSIVPAGYSAYARLLHPAYKKLSTDKTLRVSWQSVADHAGIVIDKTSQWERVTAALPNQALEFYEPPLEGTLDPEIYKELAPILKAYTKTPGVCWYGVWEGYDYVLEEFKKAPKFSLNGRSYYLLGGALTLSPVSFCSGPVFQSANIFWPDDRAWCVASEIDFCSTYIAASEEANCDLFARFTGEIFRVTSDERVTLY